MRLIDADKLVKGLELMAKYQPEHKQSTILGVCATINATPTIDAELVRHGRWIHTTREDSDWGGTFHRYTCSACNWSMGNNPTGWGIFCPACGAKMDLEEVTNENA